MKLSQLKNEKNDLQKVHAWLDSIGETDELCRREVIEQCETDSEALAYYVSRHAELAHH